MAGIFDFIKGAGAPTVTISAINIKLHGYTHGMPGKVVKERTFVLEIPFTNKTHTDMLTEATEFKAQKAEPIKIKAIEVAEPFKLVSSDPKMPLEVKPDEKMVFKLVIEVPAHNYTGPISINFASDGVETIHVEIAKTTLEAKGRKVDIETSSRIMSLPKGQIFTEKVQLYKAFSYGDRISKIEIEGPFAFVSCEPKLPIKIDDPNSCIINLYIQAPQTSYAGRLDIKMS
ncbi:MAG: hypothetical protein ABSA33_03865 [Candidatus Micrarchaeaceae archaeon]